MFIATSAQTVPHFWIIQMEQQSTIHRLLVDVWTGEMHCDIGENHMIICRHVNQNAIMKQKQIKYVGYVWWQAKSSVVAGKLSNYCDLLVMASNGITSLSILDKINTVILTDKNILEVSCNDHYHLVLLHNSIFDLHVYRKLCVFQQYYNALLLFLHHHIVINHTLSFHSYNEILSVQFEHLWQ